MTRDDLLMALKEKIEARQDANLLRELFYEVGRELAEKGMRDSCEKQISWLLTRGVTLKEIAEWMPNPISPMTNEAFVAALSEIIAQSQDTDEHVLNGLFCEAGHEIATEALCKVPLAQIDWLISQGVSITDIHEHLKEC